MKRFIKIIILVLFFIPFSINAQNWFGKKIKGDGNTITEKRITANYTSIKIAGNFEVELFAGKTGEISIESESNLMPFIKVTVVDDRLKIYTDPSVNLISSSDKDTTISIPIDIIDGLILSGSGNLKCQNTIKAEELRVELSGSGDVFLNVESSAIIASVSGSGGIELNGKTDNIKIDISGSGDVSCNQLIAKNAAIALSGSATVHVNCTENLKARISGSGSVLYAGNPKNKNTKISGSGAVKSE